MNASSGQGIRTLGLPLRSPARAWTAAGVLLCAYALTMARDLSLFDSAELSLVAVELGLGHPPGQPLHTLLGFVFAHLPGVPPLVGLCLLSALAGALCVIPAISLAETFLDDHAGQAEPEPAWLAPAIGVAVGLQAALWEPATRVEVYTLAALCALWAVARVAGARGGAHAASDFARAGLVLGLGAAANPYVSLIAALALGPLVLAKLARRTLPLGTVPAAVGGGLVGLLPYAYVPLVSWRASPEAFVWGAPTDLASLRRYMLGLDYARSRGISATDWLMHVGDWLSWSFDRGVLVVIIVGLLGCLAAGRRLDLALAAATMTVLTILLVASNTVWQPDVPDYLSYAAAPLWFTGAGMIVLVARVRRAVRPAIAQVLALVIGMMCATAPPALWARTRHRDRVARTLAAGALNEAPPNAFVIVESDHWAAPLLYVQHVERVRPDVVVLAFGLASSSWFWHQTFARHPDLRAIALQGNGGRAGRVRRLLAANAERAVAVEDSALARRLGLPSCVHGWLRAATAQCATPARRHVEHSLRMQADRLEDGAPAALAALSSVALSRGLDFWAQGVPAAAEAALLSSVPARLLPELPALRPATASRAGPAPSVAWEHAVPLGEPARNLFVAALLRRQLGDGAGAAALVRAAAGLGLPEAIRLLNPR